MPNHIDSSSRAKKTERGKNEIKLENGNPETLQSSDKVASRILFKSGNISDLAKVFKLGEKGSGTRPLKSLQDYDALRKKCLKRGSLFEDPEFPAQPSSIFGSKKVKFAVKWIRPPKFVRNPHFFVDGASRFDVKQGDFENCWFLAAVANLAMHKNLLAQVVPKDQNFRKGHYAGIFHFRFWQCGRWIDVVIDDRLPTVKGKLLGLHSASKSEFWTALLEKAYAKLHKSYTALEGGDSGEAMEDLTGGVTEAYMGDSLPSDLFDVLLKAHEKKSLMACSFRKAGNNQEKRLEGLIELHAYSITEVKYVSEGTAGDEKIPLLRVRNPWGTEDEWVGAWSDKSPEWKSIPEETKKELGFKCADDGEFWICFQDLKDHLSDLEICYLNLHSVLDNVEEKEWEISAFEGEWVSGVTAGGCVKDMEKFQYNPQYHMTLEEECTVIMELMQKNRRNQGRGFHRIGFELYLLNDDPSLEIPKPLNYEFLNDAGPIDVDKLKKQSAPDSSQFIRVRQVSCRVKLQPGSYCIIPSTYMANTDGEFLLRVFSDKPHKLEEYDEQVGIDEADELQPNQSKAWELDLVEYEKVMDFAMSNVLAVECILKAYLLDVDRSGKLICTEFQEFIAHIKKLRTVFKQVAARTDEEVGLLSTFHLRKALNGAGYHVNIHMLRRLVRRYGAKDHKISLGDFIMCALRIKYFMGILKARDPANSNTVPFTLDEWIDNTLSL